MSPILITGATGHIGTHLIKQLAAKGYPVRALVHSREKAAGLPQEVERVTGDLARPATLSAAVDGVDRVFLLDPSTGLDFTRNMVEVSLQAGVRLIVDLSSIGAGLDPVPILLRSFSAREAIIKDSGMAWTILRPGQFMSNALWWRPSIQAERVVRDPVGPGHLASIDPADIAAVAAIALTQEGHTGEIYTLTGDELLTTKMNWARHVPPSYPPDRQPGDPGGARTHCPESHWLPALAHPGRSGWPGAHDAGSYSHACAPARGQSRGSARPPAAAGPVYRGGLLRVPVG